MIMTENKNTTFELLKNDAKYLLEKELGLQINRGSAFYRDSGGGSEPAYGKSEYRALLDNPEFQRSARIVANPDLYVINRIGGGAMGLEEIRLHRKKSEGDDLVAVAEATDGNCTIMGFESFGKYLDWWAERFAGKNEDTAVNYFPMKLRLEEFLFLLHAVDSYRRVSYQNLLDFNYTNRPAMEFAEFAQTMAASLKSRDIRWLLPAFLVVTPGMEQYKIEVEPGQAAVLADQNFTVTLETGAGGKKLLAFGEAGKCAGVEFFRSWLMASGFEINTAGTDGFTGVERVFIAPTALANHFFRLETSETGGALVSHQAYTSEELKRKLEELYHLVKTT